MKIWKPAGQHHKNNPVSLAKPYKCIKLGNIMLFPKCFPSKSFI